MFSRRAATAAAGIARRRRHDCWRSSTSSSSSSISGDNTTNSNSPTLPTSSAPSHHHPPHHHPLSLGYQAGIQSTILGISFDDSYQILSNNNSNAHHQAHGDDDSMHGNNTNAIFDSQLLIDWETDLQSKQGVTFVWSTKEVSVIDVVVPDTDTDNSSTILRNRCLVFNDRPHLIQSSIRIGGSGSGSDNTVDTNAATAPPHLLGESGTHLGGLAMAVPLLHCISAAAAAAAGHNVDNNDDNNDNHDNQNKTTKEIIVIGAGACTVPMVLANNSAPPLFPDGAPSWNVRAVEPSPHVLFAAKTYFGAEAKNLELIQSTGEEYLSSLLQQQQQEQQHDQTTTSLEKDSKSSRRGRKKCQILIVDAEDGSSSRDCSSEEEIILTAPPRSMQSKEFWTNLVVPNLDHDEELVIAINIIGTNAATKRFQHMLKDALPGHYSIVSCGVPPEAGVSPRHSLLFALSRPLEEEHYLDCLMGNESSMAGLYVDLPHLWWRELKKGLLCPI